MISTIRRSGLLGLAASVLLAVPVAAQESFTIEQVLRAPMPSNLVAAPTGGAVAWVQNAEGVRNIWVAEAPDYRGRRVTGYTEDDGQALSSLQFTPDGRRIVYVRGGGPNRAGEIPNPRSEPEAAERAIWITAVDGGEPTKLAVGSSPTVSPRGDVIAYTSRGKIWSVALDGDAEPQEMATIRGGPGALRWSPDGSQLAFISYRGDHSFVGVYDRRSRSIRYLAPSVTLDRNPVWSPDGRQIAFIRIPNQRDRLPFAPRRSALPWSIVVADVATGEGRVIWTAPEGPGSAFYGVSAENQLLWGADDRLVFPWEGDGWLHLYSIPADGGEPTLLTPGEFEVQHVALTPDREEVLYSSNQDDIDRKHIWRVEVDGGRPEIITPGKGIEWSPVMTADGKAVAYLASDARTPAHAAIRIGDGEPRMLAAGAIPDDFPSEQLVEPRQVIFSAADGMRIHGQLFLPPNHRPGQKHPALLFFHGGSRRQMLLGFHHRGYYHNAYAMNQYLASRGYVVLAVNYRSGIGYGMEFREALNYGARGASEFNDVMGAGLYLQSRPEVDPDRIGLWGGSYGGYLTALGLARASDLFKAGVDLHGVHDWNVVIENFVPSYDRAERKDFAELAFESSPLASVDDWRSPVLLIHGDDDRNVPFSESVDLYEDLTARGVDVELLVFPDEVHGFLLHENWLKAYHATADFFDRKLKGVRTASRRPATR